MATNRVISAHIVVEFSDGDSNSAFVEIDDRINGFNGGNTSFIPGSPAHMLLFKPSNYSVIYSAATSGLLKKVADTQKAVEELMSFPNQDGATVRYPIADSFSYQWLGTPAGILTVAGEFSVTLPIRPIDPGTLKPNPEYRIGIARSTYMSNCEVWKLSGADALADQVLCFFVLAKNP